MESSVFKSAYYQYCHSDFSVAHGSRNDLIKSTVPGLWLKTENTLTKFLMCSLICMGESTSVFIRRFVKIEICIWRSLYFDNFQNEKNLIFFLILISFRNLVRSIHPTTCRSMFSEANACTRVAGSGENCCELAGSLLYTSEKSRAVRKKCEKQMELKVDSGGGRARSTVSTVMSKVQ